MHVIKLYSTKDIHTYKRVQVKQGQSKQDQCGSYQHQYPGWDTVLRFGKKLLVEETERTGDPLSLPNKPLPLSTPTHTPQPFRPAFSPSQSLNPIT